MHQFHAKLCCSMVVSVDFTTRVIYYIIISRLGISITEGHQLQYLAALVHQPKIQSTLFILKSKGPSETLRNICPLTYQMCKIEENTNRTTKFHK